MLDFDYIWTILEEVPVHWGSNLVHESSPLHVFESFDLVFFTIFRHQLLGIGDSILVVLVDQLLNFGSFLTFKTFKQYTVLDILNNVIINVLKVFSNGNPFLLILLAEVSFPNPESTVLKALFLL